MKKDSLNSINKDSVIQEHKSDSVITNVTTSLNTSSIQKDTRDSTPQNSFWIGDVLIPMGIFFVGVMINWLSKQISKRGELKLYKELITSWINSSKTSLDTYIDSLNNFSVAIQENESLNYAQYTTNIICFDRINEISIEKITDTFIINLSSKDKVETTKRMYNMLKQVEFLEKNSKNIYSTYQTYCAESEKIMEEWNRSYIEIQKFVATATLDIAIIDNVKEFHNKLAELQISLYAKYRMLGNLNDYFEIPLSDWFENFIKPAIILCENPIYHKEELNRNTIMQINCLRVAYLRHEKMKDFSGVFSIMREHMERSRNELYLSVEYFEKHKIKCIFSIV